MQQIALIGGSGLNQLPALKNAEPQQLETAWGQPSSAVYRGQWPSNNKQLLFLARHGQPHRIAPHQINYRANIQALADAGAEAIIAINAVGGMRDWAGPSEIILPEQIIDYSHGRESSFHRPGEHPVPHIDFTEPYDPSLRAALAAAAYAAKIDIHDGGCYACTQGPRLETAAEIRRLMQDGADIVGMTAMPEAALARELNIPYASLCLSANWAAGIDNQAITMEDIENTLRLGIDRILAILTALLDQLD